MSRPGNGQAGKAPDSRETILSSSPEGRNFYVTVPNDPRTNPDLNSLQRERCKI